MKYIIELISGKNLEVSQSEAALVDKAWSAKADIVVQGVKVSSHQITSIWPYDIWKDAENERRARRGQEPLPTTTTPQTLQIEAPEPNKVLTEQGKLWLEAIKRNKAQIPYGAWEVVDGKLSETAEYKAQEPTSIKVYKKTKEFSLHDFNKFRQVPGYRVVDADNFVLEFWAR